MDYAVTMFVLQHAHNVPYRIYRYVVSDFSCPANVINCHWTESETQLA